MRKIRRIRRRCKCGCGGITNPGRMYVNGHNSFGKKSMLGHKHSVETKEKMSKAHQGKEFSAEHKRKLSEAKKGKEFSAEHKLHMSLAKIKDDPNYQYCEVWHDKEYLKDIRKDYCENAGCKKINKRLHNHHIYLDKKRCAPIDIMTMCVSCHMILHHKLERGIRLPADPKDFIIINRPDHVSYIHKKSRTIIKINKKEKILCRK